MINSLVTLLSPKEKDQSTIPPLHTVYIDIGKIV